MGAAAAGGFNCVRPGMRILKGEPPDFGSDSLVFVLDRPDILLFGPSDPFAALKIAGVEGFFAFDVWLL